MPEAGPGPQQRRSLFPPRCALCIAKQKSSLAVEPFGCADSPDPNVRGFSDAPLDKRASYDDTERYRSLAAIPFQPAGSDVA